MQFQLPCEMLVDQGRMIGGDPVGYSCNRSAVTTRLMNGNYYLICPACSAMNTIRLTAPKLGGGETPEAAIANSKRRLQAVADSILQGAKK